MSIQLSAARANVKTRLQAISDLSGIYTTSIPKGFTPEFDAYGEMSPYLVCHFGRPVPDYGRTIADNEDEYPHIWPVSFYIYAKNGDEGDRLADELDALIRGWAPNGDDSTPFKGGPSFSYGRAEGENIPARVEVQLYYNCLVNMTRS